MADDRSPIPGSLPAPPDGHGDPRWPHGQQNTFDDYSRYPGYDHPKGSASGRYQILRKTYDDLSPRLGVRDFSPHTQDPLAAQLLTQKGAMQPLLKGDLDAALAAAAPTWRSLPSGRDQPGYDQQPYVPYDQARTLFDLYRSP